jgi:hypothetical protein
VRRNNVKVSVFSLKIIPKMISTLETHFDEKRKKKKEKK